MTNRTVDTSQRKAAKVAGLAYVLIIVLGMLNLILGYLPKKLDSVVL